MAAALLLESNKGLSHDEVLSRMLSRGQSGVISGLTSYCPNKLLYVGSGGTPAPGPTPAPTPVPNPPAPSKNCKYDESICKQYCRYSFCSGCSICGSSPVPTPAPTPRPAPPAPSKSCQYEDSICKRYCSYN